ncbi:serine/arginine repetitive matrix protein 1-like isoform X2 [Ptychodera flava]|uniref:serine/arginine repetitive matrix protein 1-like isoform X2 n=1 Tax=Ptychodera flava TaxID=63121 RepID=UPI003969F91B
MRSPQGESMSSLQDSSRSSRSLSPKKIPLVLPKGGQTQIRLGELPPKKDETRRGGSPSKTSLSSEQNGGDRKDRTQGSADFDDVDAVPDRRKEDAEVSAITSVIFDDDLTPPTTPCPDSPTDSLNLHFDLGPSLLDDVLSAWDNSKSTLESQFSPPSSESPPKSESSFSIDSPPKRGSSKKVLERQSSSTSPGSETFVKPLVNPIKKPKRSFRKDHPQKQYVMNVTDSPVSSPEVEAVPLPGSETSVIGRGDPFELTTDSHGVGSRDVFKTDASEVRPSFRKRDSDTESTDYLQLTESTSAIPEEDSKGEPWKQQLKSSSVEQRDDEHLEEKPVFLQRSMSKREVITQEGVQAYEQLVGSKKSIKRTPLKIPSRPQQSNGTESPSRTPKNSPIKTPISPPNRTTVTSPSTAPALPPSWTSARTEERTPVASPDQTPVASPVASPIKVQSKVTLESQSSISFSSSSPIKSISDSSLSRSTSSPVKTEADLQYADLLHDTSGEDTIDLANPESFTGSENKQQSSSTTSVTFSSQAPSQVYTEVQVVPVHPTGEDEVTGDFDRSDEARSSARDIIKRFEQRAQPTSVKIDDPLPTKRGVKNLKDLFTMDTKETSKPRDKSPPSSPETDKLPPLPARKQSSEDDSRPDSDIGLSPATLKNLTQSTRRTRRPVGERKIKRRSMDGAESAVVSEVLKAHAEKEEKQEDGNKDEERQKQEREISLDRQKSTEEVMKSRPLPELPEPEENNTPVVEHDYEMIETPAVPPRIPLNPQWPSKKRRSRKSSKSLGGTASPTKSSSSTSSLQQSESEPGTPDTPQGTPMSPYMNSANGEWDARTKFLLQKHASLDIYSDGDLVRSSPEEIRRHLNKERAIDKQEKSLLKTASLDRNTVLTRSHTNPTLSAMDTKEDFRKLSLTGNGNNNTKIVKDSPPQRSKSYEDVLEDILDGSQLPQAESLTDVLKRTYRTQENTEMSPTQSDASSVASAGSLEKVASVESADKSASLDTLQITEPDEGYLDMTGKHSSVALADMEWTENCQEVQEVRKALQDKISVPDIVTALKCNNWDVETTVQDIKIQHLQNKQLGDERRCRHTLIRYNWDLDKALSYLINNTYRQSEL